MNLKNYYKVVYYRLKYRKKNVRLHKKCKLAWNDVIFHGNNVIHENSMFRGELGIGSYIGSNSTINGIVGNYCSIGDNVCVIDGVHPVSKFVSTHPCFYSTNKQAGFTFVKETIFIEHKSIDKKGHLVQIGNDVWIGSHVLLMAGIKIGDGSVIAAGSVVTKDVPNYSIVGGAPAKLIKKRFDEETIQKLEDIKWWNYQIEDLKSLSSTFCDIEFFLEELERKP